MKMNRPYTDVIEEKRVQQLKGLPFFGSAFKIIKDPLGFLVSLKNDQEDVVKLKLAGKTYYVIQSPETAKHVLQENAKNYYKPGAAKMMKQFLGNGLATSNGDLWLKQRRIMQPAFHRKRIESFLDNINEETADLISKWKTIDPSHPVNINIDFLKLTLNNINKTMFGADMKDRLDEMAGIINDLLLSASGSPTALIKFPLYIPTPSNIRFLRANNAFEQLIYGIIVRRKEEKHKSYSDLLDMLLHSRDNESGTYMSAKQLRDEVSTIFMAGHETTAQTLSWAFYFLALYPEYFNKVAEESIAIDNQPGISDLPRLTWGKMIIEETMRLYPPVWIMARKSYRPDNILGYHLPAGATVLINIYGMNHHAKYWEKPFTFIPERFRDDSKEQRHPFLFIPFGAGQRPCIGSSFAMMVMQTVVCRLAQHFEFKIPDGFRASAAPGITLRAKKGIQLMIKPKSVH